MRLLERGDHDEIRWTEDLYENQIPPYAILSHTWSKNNADEVILKDLLDGTATQKAAYNKITFCAAQAKSDNLRYFWVDTCCIDKSNSSEVSEAVNSMFKWYSNAVRCYVYLSDIAVPTPLPNYGLYGPSLEQDFRSSKWFTRGWTLQELLAPKLVEFFLPDGTRLGDKTSLAQQIHEVTGIPVRALRGVSLDEFNIDERMAWAKARQTTREEDSAYCLLGILGVFMPVIYGEGRSNALDRLRREAANIPKRQEFLRKLYTCPYNDRKNRNPQRIEGTCEWFTSHSYFQHWQDSTGPSLLWVSADPGCGKSVLARYLVDEVLPSTQTRITCYFFFKDDFEDQKTSLSALSSIIRQIFLQHPSSLSDQVLERFQQDGDKLLTSFTSLWDILVSVAAEYKGAEIVCILDALDECEYSERNQLIDAINSFYLNATPQTPALRFLLTSRPYLDINRGFHNLEHKLPTIHLRGENDKESEQISNEIDLVIKSRVEHLSKKLELIPMERDILEKELSKVTNRTYLWVHLVFNAIEHTNPLTSGNIRSTVRELPQTVNEAYDKILSRSPNPALAGKLLHIVLAAEEPLSVKEMAVAMAIQPGCQSFSDREPVPEERTWSEIRDLCGLFLVVVDSRIYFLHQTAREFLVPPLSPDAGFPQNHGVSRLPWQFSFHPRESHFVLAGICLSRLSLPDFDMQSLQDSGPEEQYTEYIAQRTFLRYATLYWADHFQSARGYYTPWASKMALDLCGYDAPLSNLWVYLHYYLTEDEFFPIYYGPPLMIASQFGLSDVVQWILGGGADVNEKGQYGFSSLDVALFQDQDHIVQQLLMAGANVNEISEKKRAPLYEAVDEKNVRVVRMLLDAGADVNVRWKDDPSLLGLARTHGSKEIEQLLLDAGAV